MFDFSVLHVQIEARYPWEDTHKKRRNDHFPTLFIYFFLSRKIKKIQTKKIIKKKYTEKRAVRVEERKRITPSVDTETTTKINFNCRNYPKCIEDFKVKVVNF